MKTKLLTTIICACSLFTVQAQEWGYVSSLQNEWLRKIWTQGLDTVYIVGENGLIARSIDQAETWNKQYFPTKVALNDIIFIDHYTGFAVGEQGTILKTADAGEHWSQIPETTTSHINAIAATGLDNIWAVGDNSLILHSTDAGETWMPMNILPENDRQLTDIAFRGNLGYFTGNYATVYKTEDFGVVWDKQMVTNAERYAHFYSLNVLSNVVYILDDWNREMFSIKNEEVSWTKQETPMAEGKLCFVNNYIGYFGGVYPIPTCGGCSTPTFGIFKTNDRASKWVFETAGDYRGPIPYHYYFDINFASNTVGYAILGATIIKTPSESEPPGPPQSIETITVTNHLPSLYMEADNLIVSCLSNTIKSIELLDIQGRSLEKHLIDDNHFQEKIDISDITNGVYLVKVIFSDNEVCIKKWTKN